MEQEQLDTIAGWFSGRLPEAWFSGSPAVRQEGDQIQVVGTLPAPAVSTTASTATRAGAEAGRIARFRNETRRERIWIAREAERRFDILVQWGAICGGTTTMFSPGGGGRRGEGGGGPGAAREVEI